MAVNEPWTIRRVLAWTREHLERKGDEHARLSAEWLLCSVLDLTRVELYLDLDRPLVPDELARMREAIKRRAAGEPLQYVTGETAFRHIVVRCERGVLIPRPETELLVEKCLEALDKRVQDAAGDGEPLRVLEVGTGSGCIALSLASERPGTQVVATDISERAIDLATRNRDALELADAVEIVHTDLVADVKSELMGHFSLLVSNPPYIPTDVLRTQVPAEVADFEPELALDGGADGLDVFRRLVEVAPQVLAPGGALCVELHETCLDAARNILCEDGGWHDIVVHNDLAGRPRLLCAEREKPAHA